MLKRSRRQSALQSYWNYALIAANRQKHKSGMYIKPELSLKFCYLKPEPGLNPTPTRTAKPNEQLWQSSDGITVVLPMQTCKLSGRL